ncbi:anaerobic benzoate catabolism transcriptional regulator [Lentilactobacillus sunkii]|uniref:Anaerobic benzoate catabolism transcriptional regulator n=1 Tax=Lentilactobacillus sunkii TaxID=481719 RepID=A0A1E7XAQ1_9LACO|nr:helix-turn-helix transcriptional regulator [Lentilactobacillus sunkii]OFA10205.1 anaerobic benzoate catabolism transcriptional regulator [Lentilactobacillus sunkii]
MTQTDDLIKQMSKDRPGFKEKFEHYSQQFDYAVAIFNLRKTVGLTQQQLADKVGVPQSTIARVETGDGNITMKNMERIAAAVDKQLVIEFK